MSHPHPPRRSGFTMVELLVVILIIGILVSLLVPAIWSAILRAREAAITGEFSSFAGSMAEFKNRYHDYPPSRVILMENGFYNVASTASLDPAASGGTTWFSDTSNFGGDPPIGGQGNYPTSGTDLTYGQLAERSVRYLRKFFPRAKFNTDPAVGTSGAIYPVTTPADPNYFHDFNGNGVLDTSPILLQGHECLVFFLGGVPTHSTQSGGGKATGLTGFGKYPPNPFLPAGYAPPSGVAAPTSARDAPFYEFQGERLVDDDADGIPGYVDRGMGGGPDARYIAYFNAYGGTSSTGGYDPNDVNFAAPLDVFPSGNAMILNFTVAFAVGTGNTAGSLGPNPYSSSVTVPPSGKPPTYLAPQTFQIIAAGRDRLYGLGGEYQANASGDRLPIDSTAGVYPTAAAGDLPGSRNRERDNLTSFTGRLD